jgi:ADP-ribose pyrophosphatase
MIALEEKTISNALFTEKPINTNVVYDGKFLKVHSDRILLPNGETSVREYVRHPGSVAAVPLKDNGDVVMVKQFRYPTGETILEIPAGKMEPGEDPEVSIRRELAEEIGYAPQELIHLITIWTSPGCTDEVLHLYLAKGLTPYKEDGDSDEFIEIVRITKAQWLEQLQSGRTLDGKTVLALNWLMMENVW